MNFPLLWVVFRRVMRLWHSKLSSLKVCSIQQIGKFGDQYQVCDTLNSWICEFVRLVLPCLGCRINTLTCWNIQVRPIREADLNSMLLQDT